MAQGFFKHIPNIQYDFKSDGKFSQAKDLFRKVSVWNYLKEGVAGYSYYRITEGERPDVVAAKLYGDSTLYWLFWLVNENLQDHNDWPKSQQLFQKFLDRKYPGKCLVASNSTDIVTSTNKFTLGEKVSQSSTAYGFVTEVNPTHNRITVQIPTATTDSFTAGATVTGASSEKSFTISSVKNERDAINHYLSQNYANDIKLKTTLFNAVPGAVLGVDLDTTVNTNFTNVNVGTYVVYPTSDMSVRTGVALSFTLSADSVTGVVTMSDIIIAIPSTGYSYSEGLIVTKNMVGGQNDTAEDLGSTTLAKFTINQVGNAVVTNEEHERNLNEEKHIIQYIPAHYAARVVRDFSSLVRS